MNTLFISEEAEKDLEEIWLYVYKRSSEEQADKLIDLIEEKFLLLAQHPSIGRSRIDIAEDVRSFPVSSYIAFMCLNQRP